MERIMCVGLNFNPKPKQSRFKPYCRPILKYHEGDVELKEYDCVEVKHHKDVGRAIEEYQRNGWRLFTYQVAGMGAGPMAYNVKHYLLFEKGE